MTHGVWVQAWEEFERGWGSRPDGYYLYPSEDKAKSDTDAKLKAMRDDEAKRYGGRVPDDYSAPTGNPRFCPVSEELAKLVETEGCVYQTRLELGV